MRKVKYAKLHVNLFIAGIGELGTVLPPPRKSTPLDMYYGTNEDGSEGLHVKVDGGLRTKSEDITIPPASVAYVVYAPVPKAVKSAS